MAHPANLPAQVGAVAVGQHPVQHDQVIAPVPQPLVQPRRAVGQIDVIALGRQATGQQGGDLGVILDNQDTIGAHATALRANGMVISTTAPRPGALSMRMAPSCWSTIHFAMDSPRPNPRPDRGRDGRAL